MLTMTAMMAATLGTPHIAGQGHAAVRLIVAEIEADLPQRAAQLAAGELPRPIEDWPLLQVMWEFQKTPPASAPNE